MVLSIDTRNITARLWLGYVKAVRGDYDAAIADFHQVVEANTNNADALNNLAYLLVDYRKRPDEALQYAQKAQELAPDNPEFADTLGWVLYQKGLYSSAVQQLERASLKGNNVLSKYHLAMAYAKAGDAMRAHAMLQTALRQNPNAPEAQLATRVIVPNN